MKLCFLPVVARSLGIAALIGLAALVPVSATHAIDLLINENNGEIYRYTNPNSSGNPFSYLGDFDLCADIAADPLSGAVWGIDNTTNELRRFTTGTYEYTERFRLTNPSGGSVTQWGGLAFRSDGTLFGTTRDTGSTVSSLYQINPYTGIATSLGVISPLSGNAPGGDIVFDANDNLLYANYAGDLYRLTTPTAGTVNAALVGSTGFTQVSGLALDRATNQLVGVSRAGTDSTLFTINAQTGTGTLPITYVGDAVGASTVVGTVASTTVDLELAMMVDVSGSVDAGEFQTQMSGYVNAFRSAEIGSIIQNTQNGVAVHMGFFAGTARSATPWVHLRTAADATAFGDYLATFTRPTDVGSDTRINQGMNVGLNQLEQNQFEGAYRILDVSGDGSNASATLTSEQSFRATQAGITVNGIVLDSTSSNSILAFYQENVITGSGLAFDANNITDFVAAIQTKVQYELGTVATPFSGVYNGNTTGQPAYDRPTESLDASGVLARYSAQAFFVGADGAYNLRSNALGWDNFIALYTGAFEPNDPLLNLLAADDDAGSTNVARIEGFSLSANTQYYLVTTGFGSGSFGAFTNTIAGAGVVTLGTLPVTVPETGSGLLALLAGAGVGTVVAGRRRLMASK